METAMKVARVDNETLANERLAGKQTDTGSPTPPIHRLRTMDRDQGFRFQGEAKVRAAGKRDVDFGERPILSGTTYQRSG
jgi:hypothetical protein